MSLAFVMTPLYWSLVFLALSTAGTALQALLHYQKRETAERVVQAAFAGLRAWAKDEATGADQITAVEDALRAAGLEWGVHAHVQTHLADGLAPPESETKA